MALHRTPEEHNANPPQSWEVVKAAPRVWQLTAAGVVLDTFTTRREAEEAKHTGRWVDLYDRQSRWFAGETIPGWKPYRPPLHRLTTTYTSESGATRTIDTDSADVTAAEAQRRKVQRRKVQRLRDKGQTFTEGPGWVQYRDGYGYTVRMEWADTTRPTAAGEATPAADPVSAAEAAGRTAYRQGSMRAPAADATVCALVAAMPVGTGAAGIFEAFTRGFDAAADEAAAAVLATPDPAPQCEWPGQLGLFAPAG